MDTPDQDKANGAAKPNEDTEMQLMNSHSSTVLTTPITDSTGHLLPPDCCPNFVAKPFLCCAKCIPKRFQQRWTFLRSRALRLVEHRFFERLLIVSILASSTTLVSNE